MLGYASAILAAVLFGSVSTVAKPTLTSIHPILLSSFVYFLASLVATPLVSKTKFSITNKEKLLLFIIAICGAVIGPTLFFIGLENSTASDSALLLNGEMIFSIIFAILIFKEKMSKTSYVAVTMVVAGMIVVTTNANISTSFDVQNIGNVFIVGATLFWALDNNLSKVLSTRLDIARILQLKSLIGGSILLLLVFLLQIPIEIKPEHISNILLLGIAGFGASIFFFLHGLKRIGTVKTIMIFSTSSVFGLIFATLFLQEEISYYQIIAIGMILFGIYVVYKRK